MSAASAAREPAPISDDGGLRTALRNVPLLPAPANVDDLLARLDADEVPLSSGPLAELISDARIVEPELPEEGDDFFAATSHAANTNLASPLASRLRNGLFGAGLLAGALLIGWNALMTPEMGPLPPLPQVAETPEPRAPSAATLTGPTVEDEIGEPAPQARVAAEAIQPSGTIVAGEPVLSTEPEPQLDPVPVIPDLVLDAQAASPSETVSAQPIELPEPPQATSLFADVAVAQPVEPVTLLAGTASPELQSGAPEPFPVQPVETSASLESPPVPQPLSAAPEAIQDRGIAPEPMRAQESVASAEPIAALGSIEPEARSVAVAPRPVLKRFARTSSARPERVAADAAATAPAAAPPTRPKMAARAPYAGIWAASPEACSPAEAQKEDGHLLTRISASRARAGDASCAFKKIRRRGNVWTMTATCIDGEATWSSDVRLSLARGRLTWTSQKGSTTYMRCPRA